MNRRSFENESRRGRGMDYSPRFREERNDNETSLPEHDLEARGDRDYNENDRGRRFDNDDSASASREFYDQDPYGQRGGNISFGRRYNNEDYLRSESTRNSSPSRFANNVGTGYGQGRRSSSSELDPRWSPYQQGRYAGVGPKGYTRSDDRLKEDICESLTRHSDIDASEIEVEVKNGEVTLSGAVPERTMKYLAEDIAERCQGVKDVHNQIKMKKADREESYGSKSTSSSANSTAAKKSSNPAGSNH